MYTMCVCECVHGRGSGGALVRSEFTVLYRYEVSYNHPLANILYPPKMIRL